MTPRDATERRARGLFALLVRAYARDFRALYGQDIEETSLDRFREARREGARRTFLFLLGAVVDALHHGTRTRVAGISGGPGMLHWQDVRHALRLLRRSPWFTVLTIAVLGGGLGLSIFTFSFLHMAMVRPLPLHEGKRIVRVMSDGTGSIDAADLAAVRPSLRALTGVGAYGPRELMIGSEGARRAIHAVAAEWNIFEVSRTPPMRGRGFRADDQRAGAEPVIVLGHRTWEVAFGRDSSVVDRLVTVNGVSTRVIGIMPPRYGFPVAAEAWVPIDPVLLDAREPDVSRVQVYARLADGISATTARAELETLLARVRRARPPSATAPSTPTPRVVVQSFPRAQIGDEAPLVFGVLNLLATLILLLACINVTNLLLARANERARETAVRLALGAPRGRLIVQGLWESVLLCVAGGLLATAISAWGLSAIDGWARVNLEGNLAFWWQWKADRTTLFAAGAFVTLTLAVLGAATSLRATQVRINAVLADGGVRAGGRREARTTRVLVATQVGVVSVLMFFGVMSSIVAWRVAHMDVGYDTSRLLEASVEPASDRQDTRERRSAFYLALHDALGAQPALDGFVLRTRLADVDSRGGTFVVDGDSVAGTARPTAYVQAALGSLDVYGVRVLEGRALDRRDDALAPPVAVVSRSLAARHWPGRSAIGARVRLSGVDASEPERTVVGVVDDMLLGNPLSRDRSPLAVWVPLRQVDAPYAVLTLRHRGDAAAAEAALHQAQGSVDPLLPVDRVQTYAEVLETSALLARSVTKLFAGCFGFALLLAVSGTYGLMARSIGQRTREIGVRRALGATDGVIVRLLLGQGTRQLGVGALVALPFMLLVGIGFALYVPVGLPVATAAGVLVSATIVGVVLAATWVPTRRALAVAVRDALWRY